MGAVTDDVRNRAPARGRWASVSRIGILCAGLLLLGCQTPTGLDSSVSLANPLASYQQTMAVADVQAQETPAAIRELVDRPLIRPANEQSGDSPREALITAPASQTIANPEMLRIQIADPVQMNEILASRLGELRDNPRTEERILRSYERVVETAQQYLDLLHRDQQVELSLAECIQRALEHNYAIQIASIEPAVGQAQIVEAEAAFDAVFFLDSSYATTDQPVAVQFANAESDIRAISGGIRKLLPSGMQVSTSLREQRQFVSNPFVTLNPAYESVWSTTFSQPLLRGFGVDYNRAPIMIARANRDISFEQFVQNVRDTLATTERTYWALSQARRNVAVLAESVAQNYVTYRNMWERRFHDATPVELNNSEARWQARYVELLEAIRLVRDAEDRLKNLINDPTLKLSETIEIIPTEPPLLSPVALDQFAEVRTALEERSELREARATIEQSRIVTMQRKNETLPQLDLNFQYDVQGLGVSADSSFDNLTTGRFQSYTVSISFNYPIGNRAPEARLRQARLRESQAVVGLYRLQDQVVQEVNDAVRNLRVRYEQIPVQLDSVRAEEQNLRALQARAERISPTYLDTELGTVERLSAARQRLNQLVTDYNTALIDLEAAKGTLLDYNNILVRDPLGGRPIANRPVDEAMVN